MYSNIINNCQDMEATEVSFNRWMDKKAMGCVCVCVCVYIMECYFAKKKKKNFFLPFSATWMDLEGIKLS